MKTQRIEKGVQHKYVSRKKVKGRWVYVYPDKKTGKGRHDAGAKVSAKAFNGDFSVGDSFSAGAGKGHWHVEEIKDGQVSYKDDTTGEIKSLSVGDFKKTLIDAHKDAIQTHVSDGLKQREAVLEAAKKYGSDKQKARAEKLLGDWKKQHKEYLPKEAESKSEAAEAAEVKPSASKVEIKLATLEGSEKQVKWATDIRGRLFKDVDKMVPEIQSRIAEVEKHQAAFPNDPDHNRYAMGLGLLKDLEVVAPSIMSYLAERETSDWIDGRNAVTPDMTAFQRIRFLMGFFGLERNREVVNGAAYKELFYVDGKPDPAFAEKNKPIQHLLDELKKPADASDDLADAGDFKAILETVESFHAGIISGGKLADALSKARKALSEVKDSHDALSVAMGDAFRDSDDLNQRRDVLFPRADRAARIMRGAMLLGYPHPALQDAGRKLLESVASSETASGSAQILEGVAANETAKETTSESSPSAPPSSEKQPKEAPKSQNPSLKSRIDAMPEGKARSYLAERTKQLEQDLSAFQQKEAEISARIKNRGVQGSEAIDLKDLQNRIENLSNGLEKMSKMSDEGLIKLAEVANAAARKRLGGR